MLAFGIIDKENNDDEYTIKCVNVGVNHTMVFCCLSDDNYIGYSRIYLLIDLSLVLNFSMLYITTGLLSLVRGDAAVF